MMLGLATATIVESTRIMKKPISMTHSARQGSAVVGPVIAPDDASRGSGRRAGAVARGFRRGATGLG